MSALFKVEQQHGESGQQRVKIRYSPGNGLISVPADPSQLLTVNLMSEAHNKFVISGPNRN